MENGSWVNYSHLKEGASWFIETTCIKVSLNVEGVSPQALISVVPTVLYITFQFIPYLKEVGFFEISIKNIAGNNTTMNCD